MNFWYVKLRCTQKLSQFDNVQYKSKFDTSWNEYLENSLWRKFKIDDGLPPNLSLCCGIGAHMNGLFAQDSNILICKVSKHHYNI